MKTSQRGIDLIKSFEGLVLHPYLDSVNVPTIGYGSTMYKSGKKVTLKDPPITKVQAEELLAWEVHLKEVGVNNALGKYVVNQNQFDSLMSLSYNIGLGAFASSTLLKKIKASPCDPTIKDEFLKWNKGTVYEMVNGKKVAKKIIIDGLTDRRKKEWALYNSNVLV